MTRGVVAEFYKSAGGRITLHAMWTLTEERGHDGKTYLSRTGYDVDWSRRYDGYIWHDSSGGGDRVIEVSGIYHVSGDVQVKETPVQYVYSGDKPPWQHPRTIATRKRNATRRLHQLPKPFRFGYNNAPYAGDLLDWMEDYACQDDAVFCATCRDDVRGEDPCQHIWWCDATGVYSTPTERCKCKSREDCRDR